MTTRSKNMTTRSKNQTMPAAADSSSTACSNFSPLPIFINAATDTHNAMNDKLAEVFSLPEYASLPPNVTVKIEEARTKDLNIQDSYARDKPLSVKEHIQNWRDQCVVVGKKLNSSFTSMEHLKPIALDYNSWKFYVYIYMNKTLGWIAWRPMPSTSNKEARIHLELFNAATSIYADEVLVMGRSSKTDAAASADAAGYFGEGVKVELNRLLSSTKGSAIKYHTSGSMWEFGYSDRGVLLAKISSSTTGTLVASNSKEQSATSSSIFPHTWIELHNIPAHTFDPSDFLFINPPQMVISSKTDPYGKNGKGGVQVILDPAHHGRVYLHGIFVMSTMMQERKSYVPSSVKSASVTVNEVTPMCFGWNYCGSTANFQELRVRRDRDDLNLGAFFKLMLQLIYDVRNNYQDVSALIISLYETLENLSKSEVAYWPHTTIFRHSNIYYMVDSQVWKTTANMLLHHFIAIHGNFAIPQNRGGTNWWSAKITPLTKEEKDQITKEAELLGANFVILSEILYEWINKSDECPSLEKFWDRRGKEILEMTEYVYDLHSDILPYDTNLIHIEKKILFPNEEHCQAVKSIREQINGYFDDPMFGIMIRFKDFTKCNPRNTRRMIPLNPIPGITSHSYYIVDIQLLTNDLVHNALKKMDEEFICPAIGSFTTTGMTSANGNTSSSCQLSPARCGCVQNLLIEDILKCWPSEQKYKYDAKFRRRYLSSMPVDMHWSDDSELSDEAQSDQEEKTSRADKETNQQDEIKEEEQANNSIASSVAEVDNSAVTPVIDAVESTVSISNQSPPIELQAQVNQQEIATTINSPDQQQTTIDDEEDENDDEDSDDNTNSMSAMENLVLDDDTEESYTVVDTGAANMPPPPPSRGLNNRGQSLPSGNGSAAPPPPPPPNGPMKIKVVTNNNDKSSKRIDRKILSTIATVPKSIADQCMTYASSSPMIESEFVAVSRNDPNVIVENSSNDDCDAISGNFRQVKVNQQSNGIKIFIHEDSIPEIPDFQVLAQSENMKQFATMLSMLVDRVFHYDTKHVAIYIAATNTMALNRRGNLFFKFLLMDSYIKRHPLDALNLLYSVTCHELAHNIVKEHNEEFASAMGDLVVNYMNDFVALSRRLQMALSAIKSNDIARLWRVIGGSASGNNSSRR